MDLDADELQLMTAMRILGGPDRKAVEITAEELDTLLGWESGLAHVVLFGGYRERPGD